MSGRPKADLIVCSATDRIKVDLVIASGLIVADYGLDQSVPTRGSSALAPDTEWIITPGAIIRIKGNHLTLSFDLLPQEASNKNGRISFAGVRRTIQVEFDETALNHLVDGLCDGLTLERLIGAIPVHLRHDACNIVRDLIGWEAIVASVEARSRLAHEWSVRSARSRGRLTPS